MRMDQKKWTGNCQTKKEWLNKGEGDENNRKSSIIFKGIHTLLKMCVRCFQVRFRLANGNGEKKEWRHSLRMFFDTRGAGVQSERHTHNDTIAIIIHDSVLLEIKKKNYISGSNLLDAVQRIVFQKDECVASVIGVVKMGSSFSRNGIDNSSRTKLNY